MMERRPPQEQERRKGRNKKPKSKKFKPEASFADKRPVTRLWPVQPAHGHGDSHDVIQSCFPHLRTLCQLGTSRVWRAFCSHLGVNVSLSSGYHLQSNGQTECLNQEIGMYLRF
ncbi:hypothetical protein QTP86_019132 [Hemibagrus guttatus]|nr:hypothetical protein QTP86_019132 [Hemibagrus guttatus]